MDTWRKYRNLITRDMVIKAIESSDDITTDGRDDRFLIWEDKQPLPAKKILRRAAELAFPDAEIDWNGVGGDPTVEILTALGFELKNRNELDMEPRGVLFSVNDSVWIAAAAISYEKYFGDEQCRNITDFILTQREIRDRARVINQFEPEAARTSQWCCGDHENHTYAYLRAIDSKRRLSFPNEFTGDKCEPTEVDKKIMISTGQGEISIQKLYDFVHTEYSEMADQVVTSTNIDYIGVLDYLRDNQEVPYSNPDAEGIDEQEKARLLAVKEKGQTAVGEMKKMAIECQKMYKLDKCLPISWLDGSNTKTRKYLWAQMKYSQYADDPTSISIFVEKNGENSSRYRISLELKNDGTDKKTVARFHSYLDKPIDFSTGLVMASGSNEWGHPQVINDTQENVKAQVDAGKIRKVQLCKYIERKPDETNEYFHEEFLKAVGLLIPYYEHVLGIKPGENNQTETPVEKEKDDMSKDKEYGLNTILYGPPGTGKTYNTVRIAVSICKPGLDVDSMEYRDVLKEFEALKAEGQIAFTTFHQSYGYEEFIEGIKPKLDQESDSVGYKIEDGIFKAFCKKAKEARVETEEEDVQIKENPRIWGMMLGGTGSTAIKTECFKNNEIRLGWSEVDDDDVVDDDFIADAKTSWNGKHMVFDFKNSMEIGDLVLIEKSLKSIDAIGVITGDYEYDSNLGKFPRRRKVKWLAKDIDQDMIEFLPSGRKQLSRYSVFAFDYIGVEAVFKILALHDKSAISLHYDNLPYVFIIDEINRGNISKIFGELITLIEVTKRAGAKEAMETTLPYSGETFSVPKNVYILGTMNTADRSIALMDTALRRRFDFIEKMPDTKVIEGITVTEDGETLDVAKMLGAINQRIEYLYDREHTIGHAFFTKLKDNNSLDCLADIFKNNVIPLLQEYFYEDYEKIQLVLGDNDKSSDKYKFILDKKVNENDIFKKSPQLDLHEKTYSIQKDALKEIRSYIEITETRKAED